MRKRVTSPSGIVLPAQDAPKTQEAVRLIREEARRLWPECQRILGDVTALDDRSILWLKARARFSILDGVIRIVGVAERPQVSWRTVQLQAEAKLCPWDGKAPLQNLAHLAILCWDTQQISNLLIHLLVHHVAQEEIKRRLPKQRYDRLWRDYLTETNLEKAQVLAERLTQTEGVTQGPVRKPLRDWYTLPHVPADERISVGLEVLWTLYNELHQRLQPLVLSHAPTTASGLPGRAVPGWDAAAPALLAEDAQRLQDEWLPVLEGTMELGALKIRDAFKGEYEKEAEPIRNAWGYSFETLLEDEDEAAPQNNPLRRSRLKTLDALRQARKDKTRNREEWHEPEPARAILDRQSAAGVDADRHAELWEALHYIKTEFPPDVREVFLLYVSQDVSGQEITQAEAATKAGMSVKTFLKAVEKLQKHLKRRTR